jgi:hypothetical protein
MTNSFCVRFENLLIEPPLKEPSGIKIAYSVPNVCVRAPYYMAYQTEFEGGYVSYRKACSFVSTRVKADFINNTHKCLSLDLTVK